MMGLVDLMRVVLGVNLVLLASLGYIWANNALRFRSKHTIGLFAFAVLLFAENALALYFFVFDPTLRAWIDNATLVPQPAQFALVSIRILELCGLALLTWVTWD